MKGSNSKVSPDYKQILIDNLVRKPGLRGKVDANCIECIYDPYQDGTWRYQVTICTSPGCPMYSVRPTSSTNIQEL